MVQEHIKANNGNTGGNRLQLIQEAVRVSRHAESQVMSRAPTGGAPLWPPPAAGADRSWPAPMQPQYSGPGAYSYGGIPPQMPPAGGTRKKALICGCNYL